jgi:excisionase family DNA binding protein
MKEQQQTNVQTSEHSPWLDYDGAAAYTTISKSRLYALVGKREIPSYQPSGRTLLRKDDLDAWIMSGKREAL